MHEPGLGERLSYQWSFGTNALANQTNSTLTLNSVSVSNAGIYEVVVRGVCGAPRTNSATLTVNENVVIVTPPAAQTSFVGSNATFTVGATGTGLTYQWFFNGALIRRPNNWLGRAGASTSWRSTKTSVTRAS